jgi:hypothetical protein
MPISYLYGPIKSVNCYDEENGNAGVYIQLKKHTHKIITVPYFISIALHVENQSSSSARSLQTSIPVCTDGFVHMLLIHTVLQMLSDDC